MVAAARDQGQLELDFDKPCSYNGDTMSTTLYNFEEAVERCASPNYAPPTTKPNVAMLHAAIGMATEAGELLDNWKKAIFYGGRVFDPVNADEEVGDLLWYVMLYCIARGQQTGRTGEQVFEALLKGNTAKLRARYPERFETVRAEVRDTDAEIAALKEASGL